MAAAEARESLPVRLPEEVGAAAADPVDGPALVAALGQAVDRAMAAAQDRQTETLARLIERLVIRLEAARPDPMASAEAGPMAPRPVPRSGQIVEALEELRVENEELPVL